MGGQKKVFGNFFIKKEKIKAQGEVTSMQWPARNYY